MFRFTTIGLVAIGGGGTVKSAIALSGSPPHSSMYSLRACSGVIFVQSGIGPPMQRPKNRSIFSKLVRDGPTARVARLCFLPSRWLLAWLSVPSVWALYGAEFKMRAFPVAIEHVGHVQDKDFIIADGLVFRIGLIGARPKQLQLEPKSLRMGTTSGCAAIVLDTGGAQGKHMSRATDPTVY